MKIVLSRKGMDSGSGGASSPVFLDGRMVSLPIPDHTSAITYGDIAGPDGRDLGRLVEDLTGGKITSGHGAHLDPDLRLDSIPRERGWRPIFGQTGAAQGHLDAQGVGPGDLFLFFGRYQAIESTRRGHRYVRGSKPIHCLFGWLQVESRYRAARVPDQVLRWARRHPHLTVPRHANNTVYLASERLCLPGAGEIPGAGVFTHFHRALQLTAAEDSGCSRWRLPPWFHPDGRASSLTFHHRPSAWSRDDLGTLLQTVGRGQEFVLDVDHYPEAIEWARRLIEGATELDR